MNENNTNVATINSKLIIEGIKILSKLRGSNISAENAEAFKIIRKID